jgi:hypothetical protein
VSPNAAAMVAKGIRQRISVYELFGEMMIFRDKYQIHTHGIFLSGN